MRAAIYARQSLDKSGDSLAVSRQVAECRELAERNGWEVAEVYQDNDRSATNGKPRPEFARLLEDLRAGRHDVLICWHTDRLYRRLRDLVDLVELAERRSIKIATVRASDLDLSTPAGRMVASLLGSVASYEVQQKAARQIAANRQRAQNGLVLWARRPFGFDRDGTSVKVVKGEAAEIRKAAKAVLSGATLASVAADLNARGVTTTLGKPWTVTAVRRVLLNPRTAGRVVSKGEDYGGDAPAILDPETADRLGALLRDPARKAAPPSTEVKYLLSGLVRCGRESCDDAVMYATSNAKGVTVYRCRTCYGTRRLDLVDAVVMGVLVERLSRPDALDLLATDVDVTDLREKVVDARQRRDALAGMLADGLLSPDAARTQARRLTDLIDQLERQIADATGADPLAVLAQASDVAAAVERMSLRELREAIRTLMNVRILPSGKGVRFDPRHVALEWRER
ncbi:recombinase family protein [Phycicoccus sp. 3266]|uniref:recombinase family protein n=1 Tax=Phycicoccus sp. 3266 TaxID=2817751 RepID=UPI0028617008|nr:recombinase family protein [Phycicoccus sp. 3266]MDR6862155.1 DNA invertase Pin-like site-specific DNA recombinase [Phycicoccus sp. 3266]